MVAICRNNTGAHVGLKKTGLGEHTLSKIVWKTNGVLFRDLELDDPEVYMDAVGEDLGEIMGNIIARSYQLMAKLLPDAVLVLGDTNSCLSMIGAKRLHIPIFHMEAGNRCKDECLQEETNRRIVDIISDVNLAYSEHARRYLADCGLPKERKYLILNKVFSHVSLSSVDSFIDVGCGQGRVLAFLISRHCPCPISGVELNESIGKVAERWTKNYPNINVFIGDAFSLDYNNYTVLFLNQPFNPRVFYRFVELLENQLKQ